LDIYDVILTNLIKLKRYSFNYNRKRENATSTTSSKTDLMYEIDYNPKFVPLRSPKVNVKAMVVEGKPSYLMKNHATGKYYDLDELTNLIWEIIDGKRTVAQIVREVQHEKPHLKENSIIETLLYFAEQDMLASTLEPQDKKRFRIVSPFEIDYILIKDCNKFFQLLHAKIKSIFKRFLLWGALAFIIACAILFAGEFVSMYGVKTNFQIMGSSVVGFFFYYFVALAPVIAIHEMAHTITLIHYGGNAGEIGTGLFYFSPVFYTDTTDAWGFRRRHRIMVYLAGNVSTLFIGSVIFVFQRIVSIPEPVSHILLMVAFYCFSMSLINFAPPFETDGYYMLSDVLNVVNLRQDSYSYVGSIFRRALGKAARTNVPTLTKKKRIFVGFAILSVAWIAYIVFQTSLFLFYMAQDLATSLAGIVQSVLASQVIQISTIVITSASVLYFGMQAFGYGYAFSAAVKKAAVKPIRIEAVHDRDLAVFAYLPPQVPESLSNSLMKKMEKSAKKLTPSSEVKQVESSSIAILRMGGTNLALDQIKEHFKQVEHEFSSLYENLVTRHKGVLQKSSGIYAPRKVQLTRMFEQLARESVDAGNSGAFSIVRACEKKQEENLLYLLLSAFGTIWTIELQPAAEYDFEKDLASGLLLDDLTLTDLYGDVENFKKRIIYGFDSLANLATETDIGVRQGLARPDMYQLVTIFQPVKGRLILVGRTEQIEKRIDSLAPIFVAQTWSGYLDNLLSEASFKLTALNKARLPNAKEVKEMDIGELAVLSKNFSAFAENQRFVDDCIKESEEKLTVINNTLQQLKAIFKPSEGFKIGMVEAVFHVNVENMEALPNRIKEFRKQWKALCRRIENVREDVETECDQRKPTIAKKKHGLLKTCPFIIALSTILVVVGFQPPLAAWWAPLLTIATISQIVYWPLFYRAWRSLHKVSRHPNQAFNMIHLSLLALTEAIYGYVSTEDILTLSRQPKQNGTNTKEENGFNRG